MRCQSLRSQSRYELILWAVFFRAVLLGSVLLGATGCGSEAPGRGETDMVLTMVADDFERQESFYLVPVVYELCEEPQPEEESATPPCVELDHGQDEFLLETAGQSLSDFGYDVAEDQDDADWILVLAIVSTDRWDLAERYCFDEEELEGCVTPLSNENIQIPGGSLVMHLINRTQSDSELLKLDWVGAVDQRYTADAALGLGGGPPSEEALQVWEAGIEQAFTQSSQLQDGDLSGESSR